MQSSCEVTACPNPAGRALRSTRLCMPFPLPGRLSCNVHHRKLLQSMGGAELVKNGFVELRVGNAPVRFCWRLQDFGRSALITPPSALSYIASSRLEMTVQIGSSLCSRVAGVIGTRQCWSAW